MWDGNDLIMGPMRYTLRVGLQKTREETLRNQRLVAMAKTVHTFLPEAHTFRRMAAWRVVCWRSSAIALGTQRVVRLKKDSAEVTLHEGWYNKFYSAAQEVVEQEVRDSTDR